MSFALDHNIIVNYGIYLILSMVYLALFTGIYIRFTPYDEIGLIREGNLAAAISLTGALVGFAIPVAIVIAHSVNLPDMAAWALMATMVQLFVFSVLRKILGFVVDDIKAGKVPSALLLAAFSSVAGILNAACMTY